MTHFPLDTVDVKSGFALPSDCLTEVCKGVGLLAFVGAAYGAYTVAEKVTKTSGRVRSDAIDLWISTKHFDYAGNGNLLAAGFNVVAAATFGDPVINTAFAVTHAVAGIVVKISASPCGNGGY